MSTTSVEIDDNVVALMRQEDQPLDQTARELIVIELYRRHTISRGKAAELLGMSLHDFLQMASKLSIPYIDMTLEEWETERRLIESRWRD